METKRAVSVSRGGLLRRERGEVGMPRGRNGRILRTVLAAACAVAVALTAAVLVTNGDVRSRLLELFVGTGASDGADKPWHDGGSHDNGGANTDQNGGATADPNGGATASPNGGANTDPNGGATADSNGGATARPNGGASADPNGGANGGSLDGTETEESGQDGGDGEEETLNEADGETGDQSGETAGADGGGSVPVDLSCEELGDACTINLTSMKIDANALMNKSFSGKLPSDSKYPTVLIVHSLTSSGYATADGSIGALDTVVAVGDRLCAKLNSLGIGAVHCTVVHDADGGDPELAAAESIEWMLGIYPTVSTVIDLGRAELEDGCGSTAKTVAADGVSAQIMTRVCRWGTGDGREENMTLALKLRAELNRGGKRLCAPVTLVDEQYASALSDYYLKVDVGSSGNSVAEARLAAESLAYAIARVFNKQ